MKGAIAALKDAARSSSRPDRIVLESSSHGKSRMLRIAERCFRSYFDREEREGKFKYQSILELVIYEGQRSALHMLTGQARLKRLSVSPYPLRGSAYRIGAGAALSSIGLDARANKHGMVIQNGW